MHYCLFWKTIKKTDFYFEELLPFCPFGAAGAVTVIAAVISAFAFVALKVNVALPAATAVTVATPSARATVAILSSEDETANPSSSEAFDTVIVPVLPASIEEVALSRVITFLGSGAAVTVIVAVTFAFAFVALNVKTVSPAATAVIVATPLSIATVAVAGVPETTFNPSSSEAFDTVIVPVLPASIESVALSRVITFLYRVPKFCK
jgi:hypothetical protein